MAHVEEGGGGRQVNVEPNLVPFIDLMSVCIIFLLVTAVWTQVSMIELGASVYGKKVGEDTPAAEKASIEVVVQVTKKGYVVKEGRNAFSIRLKESEYDKQSLYDQLRIIKKRNPELNMASISLEDDLKYNEMVEGMDVMLNAGFPEVSVRTQ
jgi:biopolymer transport protein ExbD